MQEQTSQPQKYQSVNKYLYTFHITARTANDLYFEVPISTVWKECLEKLKAAQLAYPLDIHSFVLMNNHYHLLLKGPSHLVMPFMEKFKLKYFKEFKYEAIQSKKYLFHTYRYIYQNPVRANLVKNVEDYPYSSIFYLVRRKNFTIPLVDKYGFNDEFKLNWLNKKSTPSGCF
jgi:putative transposase